MTYEVTAGVPQDSVLRAQYTMYVGVLKLLQPSSTDIVGFADDVALDVVVKEVAAVEAAANCSGAVTLSGGPTAGLTQVRSGADIKQ